MDQGDRQDLTRKLRRHEQRRWTYQLSHIYDNLQLSVATSRPEQKPIRERPQCSAGPCSGVVYR